ncbi:MAG: elongation factor G [Phycisphaerales bacterium]|nr:elongation factor G [Phycisphaerales bacterium]
MDELAHIRNIGIAAHIDAGKTTTTERVLYYSGVIHKMGDVDDGTTITDFDVEEQQRGITIYSAAVSLQWRDCRINLIDTPGHVDFTAEVERSLRVLDGAVVVFDAKEGVEAQSETVWRQADKYKVPRICFINKMDKVGADFAHAVASIERRLAGRPIPIQLPLGQENTFRGYIDLLRMEVCDYTDSEDGRRYQVSAIPADLRPAAEAARHLLEEKVAELDEALMLKYIENEPLTEAELRAALRRGTITRQCQPVLCGSSLKYMGVQAILDAVCDFLPAPLDVPPIEAHDPDKPERIIRRKCDPKEPLAALVFKVVAESHSDLHFIRVYSGVLKAGSRVLNVGRRKKENLPQLFRVFAKRREKVTEAHCGDIVAAVGLRETQTGDTLCENREPVLLERIEFPETVISMAIEAQSTADRDKLVHALGMLCRSDPTFEYRNNEETGQTLISGMGELHLEVMCHRLERDFKIAVRVGRPRVAYREAITLASQGEGRFVHQAGGRAQFAVVVLRVEPFEPGPGEEHFRFVNALPEGRIAPHYLPAIEQSVRAAGRSGNLGGYPLINVKATLVDGQEHPTDSSEIAFESAAALAFQHAVEKAGPVLLEPIMKVEVVTPEDYYGAINGDLMARRAVITATSMRGPNHVVTAEAPLSSMFGYATQVRSLSQGRASYAMEPLRYERMPDDLARKVLGVA